MSRALAALAVAAAIVAAAGCGSDDGSDGGRPELVVFAAASLEPAFERYAETFDDADVTFSFAGSDDLAAQIRQGVVPDVYAAADTELPRELAKEDLLQEPRVFATNRLVIGVPDGSDVSSVADLAKPGVSIAIGEQGVPVGDYTREALAALGASESRAILANVGSEEPDVGGIVAKLTQGAVDAGFVYRSDVDASSGRLAAIEIPPAASPDVEYAIAVAKEAAEPAAAQRFVDGARTGEGQRILRSSGFGPPPPGS